MSYIRSMLLRWHIHLLVLEMAECTQGLCPGVPFPVLPEQQPCCDLLLEQHLQHLLPALYYRCIITDPQQMALTSGRCTSLHGVPALDSLCA